MFTGWCNQTCREDSMTANQINAAAVKENERHNAAVEAETERSNLANEEINRTRNQIQQDYNTTEANYKYAMVQLEEQKLQAQKDMAAASLEEKTWYDQQIAEYNFQQNQLTERYNQDVINLRSYEAYTEAAAKQEVARHNKALEDIERSRVQFSNKQLEYQKHQWDTENVLGYYNAELRKKQLQYDYDIAGQNLNYKYAELNQEWRKFMENLDIQSELKESTVNREKAATFELYTRGADNILSGFKTGVDLFNPFIKNELQQGVLKYGKKEAEKLLFK